MAVCELPLIEFLAHLHCYFIIIIIIIISRLDSQR